MKIYYDEMSELTKKDWKEIDKLFRFKWWSPQFLYRHYVAKTTLLRQRDKFVTFGVTKPQGNKDE